MAEDFAPAVGVDAHRDDDGDRDEPTVLAYPHAGGVEPKIRPLALEGAVEERADPFVDFRAQARDLALRHACAAHSLDQIIHRAGRDALDVGLLDHRRQRFLSHPARLQEAGEV